MTNEETIENLMTIKNIYIWSSGADEALDIAIQVLKATQSVSEKCKGCVEFTECADLLNMPLGHSCEDCFTDDEKRMFLTSLAREMKICEQVDIECPNAKIKLVPIIHSIQEKVLRSSLWKGVEE